MNEPQWGDKGCAYRPDKCDHAPDDGCEWCCMTCNLDRHWCPGCGTVSDHQNSPCDNKCAEKAGALPVNDTPIYEQMLAEQTFVDGPGPYYTEDNEPDHPCTIENIHGQRLRWNGKRWWDPEASDGSLQTQDCWPPYDYGPVLWREVDVP